MKKRIARQIKALKSIRPNREWAASTRSVLLSQIQSQGVPAAIPGTLAGLNAYARDIIGRVYRYGLAPLSAHPAAIVSVGLSVVFGGAVAHIASQNALPGDTLYSVKKTSEELQLVLAPTNQRAAYYLSIADRRLQELDAIATQPISDEEKAQKVASLAQDVEATLSNVKTNLESSKTTATVDDTLKVANLVGEKTAHYSESLKKAKQTLTAHKETPATQQVAQAINRVEEANTKALEVIVDQKNATIEEDDKLVAKLTETVKRAQANANEVSASVVEAGKQQEDKKQDKKTVAQEKTDEAKKVLKEAEESIVKKDFKLTLDKLAESKELLDAAEKTIQ